MNVPQIWKMENLSFVYDKVTTSAADSSFPGVWPFWGWPCHASAHFFRSRPKNFGRSNFWLGTGTWPSPKNSGPSGPTGSWRLEGVGAGTWAGLVKACRGLGWALRAVPLRRNEKFWGNCWNGFLFSFDARQTSWTVSFQVPSVHFEWLSHFLTDEPFPASFSLFLSFLFNLQLVDKTLPMLGFEPQISRVGSNHSTNGATITAKNDYYIDLCFAG